MSYAKSVPAAVAAILSACLGACAVGGGGGGGSGVGAAPTATTVTLSGASVSSQLAGGSFTYTHPQTAGSLSVAITDPDSPSASRLDQINFDGDETVSITLPGGAPHNFTAANAVNAAGYRASWSVPISAGVTEARVLRVLNSATRYVAPAEYGEEQSAASRILNQFTIGVPTATADMPRSGSARYSGAAYGSFAGYSATVDVNFLSNTLTGNLNRSGVGRVDFTGAVTAASFYGPASFTSAGSTSIGVATGAFYGPGAAEIGGVVGGFAGGAQGAFTAAK